MRLFFFLSLSSIAWVSTPVVEAQPFEAMGTRALGMAGAFVAVADDASAGYWNPAGLSSGQFFSLLVDHSDSFREPSGRSPYRAATDWSGTMVSLSTNEFGFSYYRLSFIKRDRFLDSWISNDTVPKDQKEEVILKSVHTQNLVLTSSEFVFPNVSFGTSVRYVRASVGMSPGNLEVSSADFFRGAATLEERGQNKFDVDFGLMVGTDIVRVGLVVRNFLQPTLDAPDGSTLRLDRHVRVGLGVRLVDGLLVSTDLDLTHATSDTIGGPKRNLAVGAEHWFVQWLGLRAGARVNLAGDNPQVVGAFGLSLPLMTGMYLDAQINHGRDSMENSWGIAARVGF